MKDEQEKKTEASEAPEVRPAASSTMTEFLSGMVEIGRERQGIRYSSMNATNAHPGINHPHIR